MALLQLLLVFLMASPTVYGVTPTASTPSQQVASPLSTPMLRFHSSKSWPYAARVAVALEECRTPYETIAIDLQNKPKEFCDLYARANPIPNARAKVPVLEILGENKPEESIVITESLIVTDYLAERYPEAGLMPTSSEDRATMRLFFWIVRFVKLLLLEHLTLQRKQRQIRLGCRRLQTRIGQRQHFPRKDGGSKRTISIWGTVYPCRV